MGSSDATGASATARRARRSTGTRRRCMSVRAWNVTSAEESRVVARSSLPTCGAGGAPAPAWPNATSATVDSRVPSTSSSALTSGSANPNTSAGRDPRRRRDGENVRERGACVPEGVPVGAFPVAPCVAPERARHRQHDGCGGDCRFLPGRLDERGAEVACAYPAQGVVDGAVVVDACREVGEVGADEIQLEVVERAGAACRAVVVHAAIRRGPRAIERPLVNRPSLPSNALSGTTVDAGGSAPVEAIAARAGMPVSGSSCGSPIGGSDS